MPKICYKKLRLSAGSLALVETANGIIGEYSASGYDLTLRQLYYQFVARGLVANKDKEYKRLGSVINDARLSGLIDWLAITDRTRYVRQNSHWNSPADVINSAAHGYAIDKWSTQRYRVEVWIEKDALVGVLAGVCERLDVPYFSCRGYTSASEMWAASQRLRKHVKAKQEPVILHLGDHDPSGKDMSRDVTERLELFLGRDLIFERLALNMDQIEEHNPPPNPAKITDSRAQGYIAEFGDESWELDALEPRVLSALVESAVLRFRDQEAWDVQEETEEFGRKGLLQAALDWPRVQRFLHNNQDGEEDL